MFDYLIKDLKKIKYKLNYLKNYTFLNYLFFILMS